MLNPLMILNSIRRKFSDTNFGWKAVIFFIIVSTVLLTTSHLVRTCNSTIENDRYDQIRVLHEKHLEMINGQIVEIRKREAVRESQFKILQQAYLVLDDEIHQSVEEREETYDALDDAISIDDVDRILKSGISGVSGRKD